jgi:hypothetical protein
MAITQIDPRYTSWDDWVRQTYLTSSSLPGPMPVERWKDWAQQVCMLNADAPDPRSFGHWRFWVLAWQQARA